MRNVHIGDSGILSFKGARVVGISGDLVTFDVGEESRPEQFTVPMRTRTVAFVTDYPDHWPPQPGSVWINRDGSKRWHAILYHAHPDVAHDMEGCDENGDRVILVSQLSAIHFELSSSHYRPEQVHRANGPLRQLMAPLPTKENS